MIWVGYGARTDAVGDGHQEASYWVLGEGGVPEVLYDMKLCMWLVLGWRMFGIEERWTPVYLGARGHGSEIVFTRIFVNAL